MTVRQYIRYVLYGLWFLVLCAMFYTSWDAGHMDWDKKVSQWEKFELLRYHYLAMGVLIVLIVINNWGSKED